MYWLRILAHAAGFKGECWFKCGGSEHQFRICRVCGRWEARFGDGWVDLGKERQ